MPSQRLILGTGLAALLIIIAASIGLDVKSRYEAAWVDQSARRLEDLADFRLLMRSAESVARGFALTDDPNLEKDYRTYAIERTLPALAQLNELLKDNPGQMRLLEGSRTADCPAGLLWARS